MSMLLTVADERFAKRPELYDKIARHAWRIAGSYGYMPVLLYFGKDDAVLQKMQPFFSRVYRCDFVLLSDPETVLKVFTKINFPESAASVIFLHHPVYEHLYQYTVAPFSTVYTDVVDIQGTTDFTVCRPALSFRYMQQKALLPGFSLFVRNILSNTEEVAPDNSPPPDIEYIKIPYTKKRRSGKKREVESVFAVIGGTKMHDAKHFTRYIQSAGEKMKGVSLATAALQHEDASIKSQYIAETRERVSADFSIIAGTSGTYELMELALSHGYCVYVNDQRDLMMESVVDLVVPAEPVGFLDAFVKKLRKISFKAKKISKK